MNQTVEDENSGDVSAVKDIAYVLSSD